MTVQIRDRVFEFACRVVRLHRALTKQRGNAHMANQLLRAGTGVGSNLEEAEAGQSRADFVSKVRISLKEARESHYWLRIIEREAMVPPRQVHGLVEEANEIVAILTTIVKKASNPEPNS